MSVPRLCQLGISDGYPFDDLSGARTTPTGLVTLARGSAGRVVAHPHEFLVGRFDVAALGKLQSAVGGKHSLDQLIHLRIAQLRLGVRCLPGKPGPGDRGRQRRPLTLDGDEATTLQRTRSDPPPGVVLETATASGRRASKGRSRDARDVQRRTRWCIVMR